MARAKKSEPALTGDMIESGTETTSLVGTGAKQRDRSLTMTVQLPPDLYDAWNDYTADVFKETRERVYFKRTVVDLIADFLRQKGYPKN